MKLVVYSNLHGVAPAFKQLIDDHSLDSSVWSADERTQLRDLIQTVEPSMVLIGENRLFHYLSLESQLFKNELPPYKRVVISFVAPSSTELWGAELGFDGVIDGSDEPAALVRKLQEVANGESTLQRHPAYQPPIAFEKENMGVIRCQDDIDENIVLMIAAGLEDNEIAERVVLTTQQLRKRIHRLITTANIRNRTQLVVLYSRGLMEFSSNDLAQELK